MKKYLLFLFVGLMMLSCQESDKPEMTIDQVNDSWQTTPIKKVKSADVMGMVKAFQKQWPTRMVAELMDDLKLPEENRDFISVYDEKNGFMSFNDPTDNPDAPSWAARVWNRSNGHQLFGINLFDPNSEKQNFLAFYDYDPATKTLTPEANPAMQFKSAYQDAEVWYEFYPENNELVVYEYFGNWYGALRHVYEWDGMNFTGPVTEFEGVSSMFDEFNARYDVYEMGDFTKYTLFDVDKDGQPELWLSTEDEEYQVVMSVVEGEIKILAGNDYKRHMIFHDSVIGDAGGCGTGCYYVHYVKLKNSKPEFEFADMQSYNFKKDDMEHEYSKDDVLLTEQEGEDILESFGESYDPEVEWHPFSEVERGA